MTFTDALLLVLFVIAPIVIIIWVALHEPSEYVPPTPPPRLKTITNHAEYMVIMGAEEAVKFTPVESYGGSKGGGYRTPIEIVIPKETNELLQ